MSLAKFCINLSEYGFTFTNSVDPDEMQHDAAFHLGLHCLKKYSFRGFPNTMGYLLFMKSDLIVFF